ncbi:MAG TPA: asparagine synthase (glutamine-hydrolyzing) [Candidatus Omnitrophota bacterium]|nr:asparagine synthase (glutamine-hydrolyzing) [Candidatus Omnitrophota bacterium]HPT07754.1 asparagine synthase (glutamine-hydrolyzing) [Candidatus Omnitrophota bacterium]
MCGIAGIYHFNTGRNVDPVLLQRMADVIKHRGPDGEGFYCNGPVGLAHRRLAIIDTSKSGSQPIFNRDKSLAIVYVGEVYNFKELKEGLINRGHEFYTHTDTEVVLHLYEEYGPACVPMLNGMFVFALWDTRKQELFLARDRLGIKVLYYYRNTNSFIFASEIKQLFQADEVSAQLNPFTLADFMTFQNVLDDKTFFNDIYKLPAGHYLTIRQGGEPVLNAYWDARFSKTEHREPCDYLATYGRLLEDSVKRHLVSDVEVGCYLSGGFDSSSVAYLAAQQLTYPLHTFTGAFIERKKYDERDCSRELVKKISGVAHEIVITADQYAGNLDKVMYHLDEPTLGSGAFAQYEVAKLVGNNVKVVLTGHGGDELFAGYPVFKALQYKKAFRKNPLSLIKLLQENANDEFMRLLYFLIFPAFMKEVGYGLFIMFGDRQRRKIFTADFLKKIKGYDPMDGLRSIISRSGLKDDDLIEYLYLKTYLPTLFIQEDKMGMAHSIEARTPLCDNEMVAFATSVPLIHKLKHNSLKFLTKEYMRGKLPDLIYRQPKKGFPTPLVQWYRGELKEFAYEALTGEKITHRNIFNTPYLKKFLDNFCARKSDTLYDYAIANKIYSLIAVEYWFRAFIDTTTTSN